MNKPSQPIVVFDCMVFLQALLNEGGPAAAALDLVADGTIRQKQTILSAAIGSY